MTRLRRAMGPIAAAWLVCHAATLALAPAVLAFSPACVCASGANATCPMHHQPATSGKACAMKSATATAPDALQALLSVVGPVPIRVSSINPLQRAGRQRAESSVASLRTSPPDSPPPRH